MGITIYAGNAGDRNVRAMNGAISLGTQIAKQLAVSAEIVASPVALIEGDWAVQLKAAEENLRVLSANLANQLGEHKRPILTMSRCAASIVTLPLIARQYPDALVVWFDAHGDCNVPASGGATDRSYLGGMTITGATGEWDTGFGDDLDLANVILVGARDLDPPERHRIDHGQITLVPSGPNLVSQLERVVGERCLYIHLDCDVLDAGLIATEYQSPNGLSFDALHCAFSMLARHRVLGLEITEYEDCWPDGGVSPSDGLLWALFPVLSVLVGTGSD